MTQILEEAVALLVAQAMVLLLAATPVKAVDGSFVREAIFSSMLFILVLVYHTTNRRGIGFSPGTRGVIVLARERHRKPIH